MSIYSVNILSVCLSVMLQKALLLMDVFILVFNTYISYHKKKQIVHILKFSAGLSHFRIPIAYWYWDVIEGEPFPEPNMDDTDPMRYICIL